MNKKKLQCRLPFLVVYIYIIVMYLYYKFKNKYCKKRTN